MQVVTLDSSTTSAGVVFTPDPSVEINRNSDMSICPAITGANWNGGTVAIHVKHPVSNAWYDTGVVLSPTSPGAVVRARVGFQYRLVPSAPGAALALSFLIH